MNFFFNDKIGILGLSKSGVSSAKFLKSKGFQVLGHDDNKEILKKIKKKRINIKKLNKNDLKKIKMLIVSPGIHSIGEKKHFFLKKAEKNNVEVINDIEIYYRFNPIQNYIGVTGTNGKSTTVSLLNHVLRKNKINCSLGGNIGRPICDLKELKNNIYILEISSFQLELMKKVRFKIAVLLNISKDHLERHGSFSKYISDKTKIFNNQSENDISIFGIDDKNTINLAKKLKRKLKSKIITISGKANKADIYVKNKFLIVNFFLNKKKIYKKINLNNFKNLFGEHNYQNIAAVYAAVLSLGFINWKKIEHSIKTFKPLPHRLQIVGQKNGIVFVNDSKATNIDSTEKALKNFNNIYLILGGRMKEKNINLLKKHFFRIRHVFLIGETKFLYHKYLKNLINCSILNNLKDASNYAYSAALKDIKRTKKKFPIILLSPACSSLDEWNNFEERGNAFIKYVKNIKYINE